MVTRRGVATMHPYTLPLIDIFMTFSSLRALPT
jgi:hypothetical protein